MPKQFNFFLIEDDPDDVELLRESLKDNNIKCKMDVVSEGDKVMEYLNNCLCLPDVIILDFNLPKIHGREVLKEIKASEVLKNIPIMVLTTSTSPKDMEYSYNMGVNSFVTKPTSIQGFNDTVSTLVQLATIAAVTVK